MICLIAVLATSVVGLANGLLIVKLGRQLVHRDPGHEPGAGRRSP